MVYLQATCLLIGPAQSPHTLQKAGPVDAIVAALQLCVLQQSDVYNLLCSSGTLRSAITASCSSCIEASIELTGIEQLLQFATWLSEHGQLVRSVRLTLPIGVRISPAAIEDALALGLRSTSNQQLSLFHLSSFSSSFFCGPRVLKTLPCASLTRLELHTGPFDRDQDGYEWPPCHPFCPLALGTALGRLSNLRALELHVPCSPWILADQGNFEGIFLGLAQLSCLTRLELEARGGAFSYGSQLPPLQELKLVANWSQMKPLIQLSHLTAVTSLTLLPCFLSVITLPPMLQHLEAHDREGEVISALRPLQHIKSLRLSCFKPGTQLLALTSLTSLTDLELVTQYQESAVALAPVWPHVNCLRSLIITGFDTGHLAETFTPELLHHLAAATALTRLIIKYDVEISDGTADDILEICPHISQLQQLQHLEINAFPLGMTARHLARLTQLTSLELPHCNLRELAVVALACKLKGLVKLNLSGNLDLSDVCAPAIALLTGLTHLGWQWLPEFTEEGLRELSTLKKLQQLEVDAEELAEEAVEALWAAIRE